MTRLGLSLAWLTSLTLYACARHPAVSDETVVFDADVALVRAAGDSLDKAAREIAVAEDGIVVACVDEQLTDVTLGLVLTSKARPAIAPVEVENNLGGVGIEIAALSVQAGERVTVTLTGRQDSLAPGHVRLRVKIYTASAKLAARYGRQIAAYEDWAAGTNASFRGKRFKQEGLSRMDRAIANLESAPADVALAAEARLIRANLLHYFALDWRESRAEAQRAARSFVAQRDALNEARARFVEAKALSEVARDGMAVNPTAAEASAAARAILATLAADTSAFGPFERARAIDTMGYLDVTASLFDDADRRFAQAKAIYSATGNRAGEIEALGDLAGVLVERGRFTDAAQAYDLILPEAAKIWRPDKRVQVFTGAGRSQAYSTRSDDALDNLLKAVALARASGLETQEADSLQELGSVYFNNGEQAEAAAIYDQALKLNRQINGSTDIVYSLEAVGIMARYDGDYARAIELHKEAVQRGQYPIAHMRSIRDLALDYIAAGDYREGIAQFRASLAEKLQDPDHQAYSDVRRDLAEALIDHGDGSPAILAEAESLLAQSLRQCLNVHDKRGEIAAHRAMASLLAARGKSTASLAEFERTFALSREYRRKSANAELSTASISFEQRALRGYIDVAMKEVVARGAGKPARASETEQTALRRLELTRESHFGTTRDAALDAAGLARVDALFAQMAVKSLRIAALLKRQLVAGDADELAELQFDMSRLRAEVDRERTAASRKRFVDAAASDDMSRPWRSLAAGTVQMSYALGELHAYLWVRSRAGLSAVMLSEAPETLERELGEFASFDRQLAPAKVEHALGHLSAVLLPAGMLPSGANALEIAAEGRIASVPFAGLRSPADPARRLVETHAITTITSLFEVAGQQRSKETRPFRLVALASGYGTLRSAAVPDPKPRLQAAVKEIRAVADLFEAREPGAAVKLLASGEGTAAALRDMWSSGADVVHFATHALADLRQPLASLLVLPATDEHGLATYLTAGQIQAWRGDADLVFLSACDSAIGPPRFAAGMPGLQRAFLRAGARGVIATLWPVEDVLAEEFAKDFYERYTSGETAAQSLSETQRAWLAPQAGSSEAEQTRRRITALAHGYFAR